MLLVVATSPSTAFSLSEATGREVSCQSMDAGPHLSICAFGAFICGFGSCFKLII